MVPIAESIRFAVAGERAWFCFTGRAAAERARDFDAAVGCMAREGIREIHLDMGGCPLLDSTFAGTLAGLAEEKGPDGPVVRFILHGARPRIVDGLANLDVLPLLHVVDIGEPCAFTGPMVDLPRGTGSKEDLGRFCLKAHENLGRLSDANRARFEDVCRMLSGELARNTAAPAPPPGSASSQNRGDSPKAPTP